MEVIRVLLVGAGAIANYAAKPVYSKLRDQARVVGVVDLNLERAQALASEFGAKPYASLAEALEKEPSEAVDVRTPHPAHHQAVMEAIAAGKHILVEKPIATSYGDALAMVTGARDAGVTLAVAENYSFFEPVRFVRDSIARGDIGELLVSRTHRAVNIDGVWIRDGWRLDAHRSGGGVLIDQGTHFVNLLRNVVGDIQEVHAYASSRKAGWVGEDSAVVNLRFFDGGIGQQLYSWGTLTSEPVVEAAFYGSEGSLEIRTGYDGPGGGVVMFRPDQPGGSERILYSAEYDPSAQLLVEDFLAAIRGDSLPIMSGEEGLADLKVVCAMYESIHTGGAVRVDAVGT